MNFITHNGISRRDKDCLTLAANEIDRVNKIKRLTKAKSQLPNTPALHDFTTTLNEMNGNNTFYF